MTPDPTVLVHDRINVNNRFVDNSTTINQTVVQNNIQNIINSTVDNSTVTNPGNQTSGGNNNGGGTTTTPGGGTTTTSGGGTTTTSGGGTTTTSGGGTTTTPGGGNGVDIAVTKTADEAVVRAGLGVTVNFTVTVTNNGPGTATGVVVNDPMPLLSNTDLGDLETSAIVLVSSDSDDGTYDPGTGNYTVDSLADGETAEVAFTTVVVQVGQDPVNNTATLVNSTPMDTTPGNNQGTVSFETLVGMITQQLFAPFEDDPVLDTVLSTLGVDDLTDFLLDLARL